MSRPPATPTVQIDNPRMKVTEWRFPPGGATGFHRHEMDYCVVPITTGTLTIEAASGTTKAALVTGKSYDRLTGVEHDVINDNPFEFIFIEVELKA
ncbi:MAG TPA: cupin domain-containing protein [Stellaceae bacterium]|nr:cupin domain-containing protein [Stellaceae bacterium]